MAKGATMRYPLLLLLTALATVALARSADEPREKYCKTEAARKQGFAMYMREILELRNKIEAVPPDTARYLEDEYRAAIFPPNEQRYALVTSHPFFPVWRLRKALEAVEANKTPNAFLPLSNRAREVDHYVTVLELVVKVAEAFDEYARLDSRRQPRVLSKDETFGWAFKLPVYKTFFHDLAVCAAE